VGYNDQSVGDVVRVVGGAPQAEAPVRGSKVLYSVSCVSATACVAVGEPTDDTGALIVTLNATGAIASSRTVTVPPGVSLTRISCVARGSCVLSGTDLFASPVALEVADWNGASLALHKFSSPSGTTDPGLESLSCSGSHCVAVGSAFKGTQAEGIILDISGGKPVQEHVVAGQSLYGVSCTSSTLCYSAGFDRSGGVVLAVNDGIGGTAVAEHGDLLAIACRSTSCIAVGEELAPAGAPAKDIYYGALVSVSSGTVGPTTLVPLSGGFTNVAQSGGVYTALGPAQGTGSEVTTLG
jgi:hypothetical protein